MHDVHDTREEIIKALKDCDSAVSEAVHFLMEFRARELTARSDKTSIADTKYPLSRHPNSYRAADFDVWEASQYVMEIRE